MSDTLRLTIKKKWHDMILAGIKSEEYREVKRYWIQRLCNEVEYEMNYGDWDAVLKNFKYVEFINGYSSKSPRFTIECKGIEIREGNTEWGAVEGEKYFVIKLGKIIKQ